MKDKLDIQEFGDALLRTQDLDPVYVGLVGAKLSRPQMARWLLAYWCFYHVGVASWLSAWEDQDYWYWMLIAARNNSSPRDVQLRFDRWPRAAERRHFRGVVCVRAVEWLSQFRPEELVMGLAASGLRTEKELMAVVKVWPLFGPWIAFKAADMMERVWGLPLKFDQDLALLYAEPRAALDMLASSSGKSAATVYHKLLTYFGPRLAPPGGRKCGPQEVETILCKWKSQMGGHYHVGKDIHEQRMALQGWGRTAQLVLDAYPQDVYRTGLF